MLPRKVDDRVCERLVVPVAARAPRSNGRIAILFGHHWLSLSVPDDFENNESVSKRLQFELGFVSRKDKGFAHGFVELVSCFI